MSFILDALKKSESERLRKDTPGFADVPVSSRQKPVSHWYWIIAALVIANVSVLAALYLKPDAADEPAAAMPATDAAPAAAQGAAELPRESAPALEETILEESAGAAAPAVATVAPPVREPAPMPATAEAAIISESYATFDELKAAGALQLPDMHLDIHVYSSKPEDRFVFVNMGKYKEKQALDEGPVVREITPDGVILDYRGTRFLLPRK